jgi:uncharacterized membrane protein
MNQPPVTQERGARPARLDAPLDPRMARMRFLSRFLDNSIWLPGGYRIGFDPIIGLVPGVGDFLTSTLSFWIVFDAARMGIKKRVLARMVGNVLVEALVGVVPVLGDIFDAAWKANARNFQLIEQHFSPAARPRSVRKIGAAFLLALICVYALIFSALYFVWQALAALWSALT